MSKKYRYFRRKLGAFSTMWHIQIEYRYEIYKVFY
jgi:hypothetical protein